MHSAKFVVGVARLELAALRSRTVRATKLRYTPINIHAALASSVAFLGARRACPLGLAFLQTIIFDCFCNIHQFCYFCNKNKSIISKNIICAVIFLLRHKKSIAKQSFVIYNNSRDGAWCSGSTWASDSHCVGSIPIAPANANTLLLERVFSYIRHSACLHEKSGGYKKKVTRQRVCVEHKRSATEARRKTCITLICSQFIYSFANIASRIYNNINDINGGKYGY